MSLVYRRGRVDDPAILLPLITSDGGLNLLLAGRGHVDCRLRIMPM